MLQKISSVNKLFYSFHKNIKVGYAFFLKCFRKRVGPSTKTNL